MTSECARGVNFSSRMHAEESTHEGTDDDKGYEGSIREGRGLTRERKSRFPKVCSSALSFSFSFPRRTSEQLCVLLVSPIFNHNEGTSLSSLLSCKSQSAFVIWAVGGDLIASYLNRLSPFVMRIRGERR